jgi:hypothetical protein
LGKVTMFIFFLATRHCKGNLKCCTNIIATQSPEVEQQ